MFIILLVATATLDGLSPCRMVLNCFHLLWTIVLIYFWVIFIYTWLVLPPYNCSYFQAIYCSYFQVIYFSSYLHYFHYNITMLPSLSISSASPSPLFRTIILIYFELFWYILLGWFYRLIIILTFKLIIVLTFKLFTFKLLCLIFFTILLCFHLLDRKSVV